MTFRDISMKMLRASFRRYRLFFLCNVFSVVLFYCFAAIFTNQTFMNEKIVDPMISSNIIAPSVFVAAFLILFIPYSYHAFLKNRKQEYGILMSLGMSQTEVLGNMLLENITIAMLSLSSGLVLGTAVSFAFYFIIQHAIGVSELQWYFNADSYRWTALVYGTSILLALLTGVFGFAKAQLIDLLKEKYRAEKGQKARLWVFITGVALAAAAVLIMALGYGASELWFAASLVLLFTGIGLTATHWESAARHFSKRTAHSRQRHILGFSFVRQHSRSQKRIGIIGAGLFGFSLFFAGLCAVIYWGHTASAAHYSPYDLVYSQIFGKNQVQDDDIIALLNQNHVSVKSVEQVDYARDKAFTLLPVSEVNRTFNCSYQVAQGQFLQVYQYDLKDGYAHDRTALGAIQYKCGDETIPLQPSGSDVKILFNPNPTFADKTLVLNDADYKAIASKSKDVWAGVMKLYTFGSWKDSKAGVAAVQQYLLEANRVDKSEENYYRASSMIETWTTMTQSAEFLIFLLFFIIVLFCAASNIMIHFKIKAEAEEEQRMLAGLYRIGVTAGEMAELVRFKNLCYFLPQVILGLLIGAFYCFTVNAATGYGWMAAGFSVVLGLVLLAAQYFGVMFYSIKELLGFNIGV
jgi:ABC-type antimicrobial peptide transport system permease subunit